MVKKRATSQDNSFSSVRKEYQRFELSDALVPDSPFQLFSDWYQRAEEADIAEPNAMALATANQKGDPHVRFVLLKEYSQEGFVFYTNLESVKALDLKENPRAALVFYWQALEQQVRIEGSVQAVPAAVADSYFASRPRGAQLGAIASTQSRPLLRREELEVEVARLEEHYAGIDIPRPAYWGGYCVRPERFEFWQGRESRLHDRIEFSLTENDIWIKRRLYP